MLICLMFWLAVQSENASVPMQPVPAEEPHLDGEGAHLQGYNVPAGTAAAGLPIPRKMQVAAV